MMMMAMRETSTRQVSRALSVVVNHQTGKVAGMDHVVERVLVKTALSRTTPQTDVSSGQLSLEPLQGKVLYGNLLEACPERPVRLPRTL
mmetsp:Transcript_41670/g.76040  ORF Transcript_41670/g.76040 Transcript_41670/m.76040 type:complete len:89 (+) Transcript_41670:633-899(+)